MRDRTLGRGREIEQMQFVATKIVPHLRVWRFNKREKKRVRNQPHFFIIIMGFVSLKIKTELNWIEYETNNYVHILYGCQSGADIEWQTNKPKNEKKTRILVLMLSISRYVQKNTTQLTDTFIFEIDNKMCDIMITCTFDGIHWNGWQNYMNWNDSFHSRWMSPHGISWNYSGNVKTTIQ